MRRTISLVSLLLLAILPRAYAGWWIFGQGANEVKLNYIYICGASLDEAGPKLKIPTSSLKDGQAVIKGRASVRKGTIGAVLVSLTEPADWQKSKLASNGTFEYSFSPEAGKTYNFSVKAMDTAGKTSDVAATQREIVFTDMDIRAELIKALDALITAYQAENPAAFMAHVSPDFAGDTAILDTAVRKDFSALSEIRLAYTLSGLAFGQAGKTSVALNYRRQVISSRDGKSYSDSGTTEFVFKEGEKGWQVYSMKNPLIFGLSLADEVGTGTVTQPPDNVDIIVIGPIGTVDTVPPTTIGTQTSDPILVSQNSVGHAQGLRFSDNTLVTVVSPLLNGANFSYNAGGPFMMIPAGTKYYQLNAITIATVTQVPDKGTYSTAPATPTALPLVLGFGYAFYLPSGNYVALEIGAFNGASLTVKYKYQPNGTNLF